MKDLTLIKISEILASPLVNETNDTASLELKSVVIDSRKAEEGGLFIATKGEKTDGHSYIKDVKEKGVLGVVCEKVPDVEIPYILVEDSFKALSLIAKFYRSVLDIPVIGVTGSVGKTSTKEFIAGTLSAKLNVLKTIGNFNNEVGMPLTLLSIREEHQVAVIEMGISEPGEMTRLSEVAKPDICVITNIGECHLEKLIDRDGVLKAKTEIFKHMNKEGSIYLNGDDDKLITVKKPYDVEPVRYGFRSINDISVENIKDLGLLGSDVTIILDNNEGKMARRVDVHVPLPGRHMILNAMVAAGIADSFGLSLKEIAKGIASVKATGGRSNVIRAGEYTVIDDCYNANPTSMKSAIKLLNMADTRKVAILGDMFELGADEKELHREVGAYAVSHGVDVLITIGELSKNMFQGALECGRFNDAPMFCFDTKEAAMEELHDILKPGDSILIKASHGMHLEKIVEFLKERR